MGTEIERKFLVKSDTFSKQNGSEYKQGYLNTDAARTVRVRVAGAKAFITVKGKNTGASRAEFEYEVPVADANDMLKLCEALIEKTRYIIVHEGMTWEVDVFHGDNKGLIMAEIELENEEQVFAKPEWLGKEVTGDARYYNSNLASKPYSKW